MGTPNYQAPEMLRTHCEEAPGYTMAADWWSYGVLVYEVSEAPGVRGRTFSLLKAPTRALVKKDSKSILQMLTGDPLFPEDDPRELSAQILTSPIQLPAALGQVEVGT